MRYPLGNQRKTDGTGGFDDMMYMDGMGWAGTGNTGTYITRSHGMREGDKTNIHVCKAAGYQALYIDANAFRLAMNLESRCV